MHPAELAISDARLDRSPRSCRNYRRTATPRRRCVDGVHDGMAEVDDELWLERAKELGRILFSQDSDFRRSVVQSWWKQMPVEEPRAMYESQENQAVADRIREEHYWNGQQYSAGDWVALLDGQVVAVAKDLEHPERVVCRGSKSRAWHARRSRAAWHGRNSMTIVAAKAVG